MDQLLELESRLSEAERALDRAQRIADEMNDLALTRELRARRDWIRLRRLRVADRAVVAAA